MKRIYLSASILLMASTSWSQTTPFATREYIDINNIKAGHLVHGDMWWDPVAQKTDCEYPKGSGKHAQFASALWIGGYDPQNTLHVSAQTYRQDGNDYWPGPLDNAGTIDYSSSEKWAKIWKVNRSTIDSFHMIGTHTLANTPESILTWPGKGNPNARGNNNATLNITTSMAPFADVDNDGIYNPLNGDYPNIKGDQMLWWIINDNGPSHQIASTAGMKLEIQTSVYAYNQQGMLNTIVYYEYLVSNKAAVQYDSLVVGLFSDGDLGYAFDDYIGFDSTRRMGVLYNGNSVDGSGQVNSYGTTIPMSAVSFMELPGDSYPSFVPAGSFLTHYNLGPNGPPTTAMEHYYCLTHRNMNGTPQMQFGMPVNYINQGDPGNSNQWSECMVNNLVGDRRFDLASNKFSLPAGSTKKIAMAFIIKPNVGGCPNTNFTGIRAMGDSAFWYYYHTPAFPTAVGNVAASQRSLKLYPNPANNTLFIERPDGNINGEQIVIFDALGRKMEVSATTKNNTIELSISHLTPGVYTVVYRNANGSQTNIFVKE